LWAVREPPTTANKGDNDAQLELGLTRMVLCVFDLMVCFFVNADSNQSKHTPVATRAWYAMPF
jgi:hypothetical protein